MFFKFIFLWKKTQSNESSDNQVNFVSKKPQ